MPQEALVRLMAAAPVYLCGRWAGQRYGPSGPVAGGRMDYAELLQEVQAAAALDQARAERVIWTTVMTLAERMSHAELVQLGARLPDELQAAVRDGSLACQPFGADEFVHRVAIRIGAEPQKAWTHVRAVLGTLGRDVAEMEAVRQRLPRDFDALMA
jgi:uncharacterized protein (DUF2267 family)